MTDTGWAGRGFTGPPAAPDPAPSQLRVRLRKIMADSGMLTLEQVERHFAMRGRAVAGSARRELIAELAAMRDDGEVRFEGPRYVLVQQEDEIQPLHQWRPVREGVQRDTDGTILRGPSLPCGCPLDADCTGYHNG